MGYGFGGGYGGQCCGKVGGFADYCGSGRNVSNFALLVVMFILLIIVGANINFDDNKRHHGKGRC